MKWSELEKKAREKGWYFFRHGKEHDIYAHAEKDYQIQIGRHKSKEIANGTFQKLKKQIPL
jgi:predicted RNA binding protein YcfA (HicA-like mRNA interferase family)